MTPRRWLRLGGWVLRRRLGRCCYWISWLQPRHWPDPRQLLKTGRWMLFSQHELAWRLRQLQGEVAVLLEARDQLKREHWQLQATYAAQERALTEMQIRLDQLRRPHSARRSAAPLPPLSTSPSSPSSPSSA